MTNEQTYCGRTDVYWDMSDHHTKSVLALFLMSPGMGMTFVILQALVLFIFFRILRVEKRDWMKRENVTP